MNLFPSPLRFGWPASAAIAITCLLLWAAPAPAGSLDDARAYWERGELNAAGLVLKEHLRTEAEDAAARILLARVYLDLYQGDAALKELETAQRLGAPRARLLEPRARALLLTGAHQRVLDEVAVAAVADPAQRAVLAALRGDAERGLGNTDAALAEYERALELAPAQTDALLGKARLALAERRIDDARELLVAATTANPEAARAWELLAEVDFARGEHAAAEQSLVKAVIAGRNKWLPRFKRALTRIELGELQAAAADIDAVARTFPNFPGLSFARGALLLQQGELDAGLSALETYLKYDPNNLRALFLSAIGEAERGNLELASDLLTRYRKRLPDSVPASRALAEVLLRQRKPSAAEALLREALQARPDRPELLLTLAQALSRQGEWEAASAALLRVVDIQPDVADHRFAAAEYLHRIGEHDAALAQLEQALALDPLHRSAPLLRIKVLLELKRMEEALTHAETLIRARRNDPYALNAHGLAQLAQGDAAAARRSFRAALDAAPAFPDAALNLAKLSLREGDPGGARALLEDVVAAVPNHVEATLALAELDASAGDIRGQQRRLRAVLDAVPDEPRFLLALAQSYLRNGTPERARLLVQSAPERLRERAEMMLVLGQAQASVGDLDAALETFQALLLKTPESATPNFLLAALYAERKNRPAMEEALLEGATKAPDSPLLRSALAAGKTLYKDPALRLSLLDRLLRVTDNAPRLVAAKADLLVEYGDHARAERLMRGLLMRYPDDFGVLHKLVEIQLAGNAQPAAEEVLTAWLERHPDDVTARVMLAQVQAELGRDAAARELLEGLMASDPALASDPLLLNNLAWLLRETDPEQALKYAERAYRDEPGSAAVKDTLGNLLVHAGELQRGLGLLEQAARAEPTNATIGFHYAEALAMAERDAEARVVLLNLLDKDFPERSAARALLKRLGG
ncbi:XrtA/PEP-CTERM system TPR-repeat protein PrsT [uncultured Thiohalocapsa sp.]|uniref:XrtA/PEP-CTERM system TPR-repeat protein PrsT n=1 Tax=uncultured Thiohalocapsa sp. TaxID=768990 RepID=UPI0025F4A415|nr:XrtA/PEP-CTERM system TPR-repeat protein PrsT [uncultured Thiohalocapsa sp.]